jgi:pimeloyl-ACP methyl ester carboxylesterase
MTKRHDRSSHPPQRQRGGGGGRAGPAAAWLGQFVGDVDPAIEILKPRFPVIAPDLFGYGRTVSWPAGHDFSLAEEVRLIAPLIEGAPETAHVVA